MTDKQAQVVAKQLGAIPANNEKLQAEIQRLNRKTFVPLEQVKNLHDWLEGKRQSRQSGRVVGESRTGKTMGCDAYRLRHKPKQKYGKPPTVPVVYIQIPQECGARELFSMILEYLKYQAVKGTVAEIRNRAFHVLKSCAVEMVIIDEADRLKPKTFAEVRDIFDKLEIPVILVGTDRLDTVIKRDEQVYNRFRAREKLSLQEIRKVISFLEEREYKPSLFTSKLVFVDSQLYLIEDWEEFGMLVLEASGKNKGQIVIHQIGKIGEVLSELRTKAEKNHVLDFDKRIDGTPLAAQSSL
ncbi:TniB family NTP-binding protein [Mastigocoleus testarum]|uniref:TniB family NTP-binding protein n=1 Tax=Mastigocoleus testarum TaxID=996925 RepID=UPI0004016BA0|nr:TniB family NTP-binding protein [Mastigocoleus testarum]